MDAPCRRKNAPSIPGAIEAQCIAAGLCQCRRGAVQVSAEVRTQQADFAGYRRAPQGQVAPRCDAIAIQGDFTRPLEPRAGGVDVAAKAHP